MNPGPDAERTTDRPADRPLVVEATAAHRRAASSPGAQAWVEAAEAWLRAGRLGQANAAARDARRQIDHRVAGDAQPASAADDLGPPPDADPDAWSAVSRVEAALAQHQRGVARALRAAERAVEACAAAPHRLPGALAGAAEAYAHAGDHDAARRALGRLEALGDVSARTALARAMVYRAAGRPSAQAAQAAARAAQAAGDAHAAACAAELLLLTLIDQRDYSRARAAWADAARRHHDLGDLRGAAVCVGARGLLAFASGLPAEAGQHLTRCVRTLAQAGFRREEAWWRAHLDDVIVHLARDEWRIRELDDWIQLAHELEDATREAALCCELGNTWRRIKDPARAAPAYARALEISRALGDPAAISVDLANLGQALAERGDAEGAAAALREALSLAGADAPHGRAAADTLRRLAAPPG
jgi:tetratricopeptide (TPR) repeat protein